MSDDEVLRGVDAVQPDVVQVHGPLGAHVRLELSARGLVVVKALSIGEDEFASFDDDGVDAVLVVGPYPGSGVAHSWAELSTRQFHVPMIAAGGLTPAYVAHTIEATRANGVDTASGVEASPGIKDHTLVRRFVETARRTFEQQGAT